MSKYWHLFKVNLLFYFTYRINFFVWRFRQLILPVINFYLWSNVYAQHAVLFGYSREQMLTYVVLSTLVSSVSLSSRTPDISSDILSGKIISQLLRPLSFFKFALNQEFSDKFISIFFTIIELIFLVWLLHIPFILPTGLSNIIIFSIGLIISLILTFFISLSISYVAFWTPEAWAPRFLYTSIASLVSGLLFPLDVLPHGVYQFLLFTPFPYMIYIPAKLYLHSQQALASGELWFFMLMGVLWCSLFLILSQLLWKKGIKEYSFYGR